jgi:hypothetical protein
VAVVDEVDALAVRARHDLDDLFNFGVHIHLIWRHFKIWVHQGNTLRSRNIRTGAEVTERDLIKLYGRYRTTYLLGLSFVQTVTVFEAFLFDFLRILLTSDPRHLAQKRQIEVGMAISVADRAALVSLIAERELNELRYDRPKAWFEYLHKIVKLRCPTDPEVERVAEMKAARDLLIHNSGIVNEIYLNKAGTKARFAAGEKVVIDRPYFDECWALTKKLVDDLATSVKSRLAKSQST